MLFGLIRQSQEAEIKGERDSQDRLRKAVRTGVKHAQTIPCRRLRTWPAAYPYLS